MQLRRPLPRSEEHGSKHDDAGDGKSHSDKMAKKVAHLDGVLDLLRERLALVTAAWVGWAYLVVAHGVATCLAARRRTVVVPVPVEPLYAHPAKGAA